MSLALPLASAATVDVASGATIAAGDDDADGASEVDSKVIFMGHEIMKLL